MNTDFPIGLNKIKYGVSIKPKGFLYDLIFM